MTAVVTLKQPIPQEVASLPLLCADGSSIALKECWAHNDALIVCVRHFGCVACAMQIGLLRERLAECEELSLSVTILGCAQYQEIQRWIDREQLQSLRMNVYTDPTLRVHQAMGLHHGFWRTWGPQAVLGFLRAVGKGYRPHAFQGEVSQQAGAMVVDQKGVLWGRYQSEYLGDLPPLNSLIETAMTARISRENTVRL